MAQALTQTLGNDTASCFFLFALSDPLHQRLRHRRSVHQRPGAERELRHPDQQVNITNVLTSLW